MRRTLIQENNVEPSVEKKKQEEIIASVATEERKYDSLKERIDSIVEDIESAELKKEAENEELSRLVAQRASIQADIDLLTQQKGTLLVEIDDSTVKLREIMTGHEMELNVYRREIGDAKSSLESVRALLSIETTDYDTKKAERSAELETISRKVSEAEEYLTVLSGNADKKLLELQEVGTQLDAKKAYFENIELLIRSARSRKDSVDIELSESFKKFNEMQDKIYEAEDSLIQKQKEIDGKDAQIENLKAQILGISSKEERVNALIPRLIDLYEKAGIKIVI
jgi:chromosome segregation ATPase